MERATITIIYCLFTELFHNENGVVQLLLSQYRMHIQQERAQVRQAIPVRHYNRDFVPGLAVQRRLITVLERPQPGQLLCDFF